MPTPAALIAERRKHGPTDHSTGAARGPRCANCNKGIGNLGDDPERLIAAAAYLIAARGGD